LRSRDHKNNNNNDIVTDFQKYDTRIIDAHSLRSRDHNNDNNDDIVTHYQQYDTRIIYDNDYSGMPKMIMITGEMPTLIDDMRIRVQITKPVVCP
jgi:hypothetical protein